METNSVDKIAIKYSEEECLNVQDAKEIIERDSLRAFTIEYLVDYILGDNIIKYIENDDWFEKWYENDLLENLNDLDKEEKEKELSKYEAKNENEYIEKRKKRLLINGDYSYYQYMIHLMGLEDFNKMIIELVDNGTLKLNVPVLANELTNVG